MSTQLDQTLFTQEEPLFESGASSLTRPASPQKTQLTPKKLILIAASFIFLLILLLTIIGAFMERKQTVIVPQVSPTPTPTTVKSNSQLDQLFLELAEDIQTADPTENLYPFPPIESSIRITPLER